MPFFCVPFSFLPAQTVEPLPAPGPAAGEVVGPGRDSGVCPSQIPWGKALQVLPGPGQGVFAAAISSANYYYYDYSRA